MQGFVSLAPTHCACLERRENNAVLTHPDSARAVRAASPAPGQRLGGSTLGHPEALLLEALFKDLFLCGAVGPDRQE